MFGSHLTDSCEVGGDGVAGQDYASDKKWPCNLSDLTGCAGLLDKVDTSEWLFIAKISMRPSCCFLLIKINRWSVLSYLTGRRKSEE
ncbi:hypothetical protein D3C76_1485740 [compost metagenome]